MNETFKDNGITWIPIMWTNFNVYINAQMTKSAAKNVIRTNPGECIRFSLYVYENENLKKEYKLLHFQFRNVNDKDYFDYVLAEEHRKNPKAKFRVFAYKAKI